MAEKAGIWCMEARCIACTRGAYSKVTTLATWLLAGGSHLRSIKVPIANHWRVLGLAHELWYGILESH